MQVEDPDGIGYIPRNKLFKHFKKLQALREFEEKEAKTAAVGKDDKDLIEHLRSQNVSQDIILELNRSKANPAKGGPEILDLDTLMALDNSDLTNFAEIS